MGSRFLSAIADYTNKFLPEGRCRKECRQKFLVPPWGCPLAAVGYTTASDTKSNHILFLLRWELVTRREGGGVSDSFGDKTKL